MSMVLIAVIVCVFTLILAGIGVAVFVLVPMAEANDTTAPECTYTGDWSAWGECVDGQQTRTRPYEGDEACNFQETQPCEVTPPVATVATVDTATAASKTATPPTTTTTPTTTTPTCNYTGDWTAWGECVDGQQTRTRPYEGDETCDFKQTQTCIPPAMNHIKINMKAVNGKENLEIFVTDAAGVRTNIKTVFTLTNKAYQDFDYYTDVQPKTIWIRYKSGGDIHLNDISYNGISIKAKGVDANSRDGKLFWEWRSYGWNV